MYATRLSASRAGLLVPALLLFAALLFIARPALADPIQWSGEIDGTGPEFAVMIAVQDDADAVTQSVYVVATNSGSQPWGGFHFGIYDPMGGQDISNIEFTDSSLGGPDPSSSQVPLTWTINNVVVGAILDLSFHTDAVMPGETAWFQVYYENPDNISFFGVLFYPTPLPERACCFENGDCEVLRIDACETAGGVVHEEAETCEPEFCPLPLCACCFDFDDTCHTLTEADCLVSGGTWHVGSQCLEEGGDISCPIWRVCCVEEDCYINREEDCASLEGRWLVDERACEPGICVIPVPSDEPGWGAIKSLYR
ncbi:MAG: hypothetical protein KBD56_07035 [Candidatus Eisenbacteria bacterium]|nr:hypothetical protein [Candidatus Eisenbacteria bacterium]